MQDNKKGHTSKIVELLNQYWYFIHRNRVGRRWYGWLSRHLTRTHAHAHMKTFSGFQGFHPQTSSKHTFIHLTSRADRETRYLSWYNVVYTSRWCSTLLCAPLCCPTGYAMCISLILRSVSSIRELLLAAFSSCHTRWTHRWTQPRPIGPLAQSGSSTSCFNLSSGSTQIPKIMFYMPVNGLLYSHMIQ